MIRQYSSNGPQQTGWNQGRMEGYHAGWSHGYRLGRSEPIYGTALQDHIPVRELKVLYITSGIGVPYPALDEAIIESLGGLVQKLIVAGPADPVADLSAEHQPDLVLALNGVVLPENQVYAIRNKGIKTAIWFTDDPYYTDWTMNIAPRYDYVFTLEVNCVSFYKELGCDHVYYLPFAMNPKFFYPKATDASYRTDIAFIGTAYWNRVKVIDQLASFLAKKNLLISGWWWNRLNNYSLLKGHIRLDDWLTTAETASYYNGARMVINLHRSSDDESINHNGRKIPANSINPRTFEINACNTLQLIDSRNELTKFYVPNQEIVVYASPEQLQDRISYYLKHEEERREIAFRGFVRTMNDHTYRKRLNEMLGIIFH
jgi:spore maturation protein CgeB